MLRKACYTYANSQRYKKYSVFWLAQMALCIMTLCHALNAFCWTKHHFRWSEKRVVHTSILHCREIILPSYQIGLWCWTKIKFQYFTNNTFWKTREREHASNDANKKMTTILQTAKLTIYMYSLSKLLISGTGMKKKLEQKQLKIV